VNDGRLPPLLQGLRSPELQDFEKDIGQLILDIHEVSRKPAVGPAQPAADRAVNTGYSPAATAIAKLFVERTTNALYFEPNVSAGEIAAVTGLSEDDIEDALHELGDLVENNYGDVTGFPELYATFDKHYKEWDPAQDALPRAVSWKRTTRFFFGGCGHGDRLTSGSTATFTPWAECRRGGLKHANRIPANA
jgi:hypothetical protein